MRRKERKENRRRIEKDRKHEKEGREQIESNGGKEVF